MLNSQFSPSSRAIENKLLRLSRELEQKIRIGNYSTEDEFFAAFNESLWDFYTYLRVPMADRIEIKHRDTLSPTVMLQILKAAVNDIQEGYDRIGETQDEILRRNNRYASSMRDVLARIQHANNITASVSRVIEDNTFEVGDSFADETLLDGPGPGGKAAHINGEAGLLSLSQLTTTTVPISTVKVLKSSNGSEQRDHPLAAMTDGSVDTWFEYRRTGELDNEPLVLELLISLQTVQIVNQILIFPLGLDDRAFPRIIDISTSLDGKTYESIRSSIPTFLSKEEEDALFILGPIGFRNQDHADFTFTPRTCQFIRLKIQQGKRIRLENQQQLRIAIRDFKVNQIEYEDTSEIMSRVFPLAFSPRKLKLIERAVETEPLTSLLYQVSFDEGAQWYDIVAGQDVEINTGSINSLDVPGKLASVKLKILAARDRAKFNGLARPLAGSIRTISNRIGIDGVPVEVGLENIPLESSLLVSRLVASVGTDYAYPLQRANGEPDLTIDLPISIRPFSETVKVNGQAWTRVADFNDGTPSDRWYSIDYTNQKIRFSDARLAMLPEGEIGLQLDPEPVLLPDSLPLKIDLDNAHDFNAEHTAVYWYDRVRFTKEEPLGRGATKFQVENFPVVQTIDTNEDIPTNVGSFYLDHITNENGPILFSDTAKFAILVEGTPSAAGEYSVVPVVSGIISPLLVTVYGRTNPNNAGTATMEARAKIISPKSSYDSNQWLVDIGYPSLGKISGVLETFYPQFSDNSVFKTQKTFVDGSTEMSQAGDYSIDHENGTIYSFAPTQEQGTTFIKYSYQTRRALNWEFVSDNPKQLVINDDSFLVTKNDQFAATVIDSDDFRHYIVYKDNRYIWVPVTTSGTSFVDSEVTIPFTSDDFLRGYILPAGRTRIRLPHQLIVRNSLRFFFLSNDTNAYDDRIVTRNDDGSITVSPKPIRDVYGTAFDGIGVGARTQRDVDKLSITRERPFVDGKRELEKGGDYSVDYENGILYTYTPVPQHTMVKYEYADVRVTYVATQILRVDEQYTLDLNNLILNITSIGGTTDLTGSELLVRYDIIDQLREDPVRIYRHYSPLLLGYQLKIKP